MVEGGVEAGCPHAAASAPAESAALANRVRNHVVTGQPEQTTPAWQAKCPSTGW